MNEDKHMCFRLCTDLQLMARECSNGNDIQLKDLPFWKTQKAKGSNISLLYI